MIRLLMPVVSVLVIFAVFAMGSGVSFANAYSAVTRDGIIIYEAPTIVLPSQIPVQVLLGLGVALVAIAILVLYKTRK